MGFLSLLIVFVSGAIFGTGALVLGLLLFLNVGADQLDRSRERANEKRKKFTHLDAKRWLPKPRAVLVAALRKEKGLLPPPTSGSSSSSVGGGAATASQVRRLVIDLIEATNLPVPSNGTIDASVRIRLNDQRIKSRTVAKAAVNAKWDQTFVLRVENALLDKLELSLMDDSIELATCTVPLNELLRDHPKESRHNWILRPKQGEATPVETAADVKSNVPLTKSDLRKTGSTKLTKEFSALNPIESQDESVPDGSGDSSGMADDSLDMGASEDISEDITTSPPMSPRHRASLPVIPERDSVTSPIVKPRSRSNSTSSSPQMLVASNSAPTLNVSSVSASAHSASSIPIIRTSSVEKPMYNTLRVVGKKGSVKQIGVQGWVDLKPIKKASTLTFSTPATPYSKPPSMPDHGYYCAQNIENYEKYWIVIDGNVVKLFETSDMCTYLGSLPLEKAKVHKSRTKRHHMTVEINKNSWQDYLRQLEDTPLARHPSIVAAEAAGVPAKDPPMLSIYAVNDTSIKPWVEQFKLATALTAEDLKRWHESGADLCMPDEFMDAVADDEDESATQATNTSISEGTEESSANPAPVAEVTSPVTSPKVGLSSSADKKQKKSRRTMSKDSDEKKRTIIPSSSSAGLLAEPKQRNSLPIGSLKGLDAGAGPDGLSSTFSAPSGMNLRDSVSAMGSTVRRRAVSSVPELGALSAPTADPGPATLSSSGGSISPKRASITNSGGSQSSTSTTTTSTTTIAPSSSGTTPEEQEDAEIDYITTEMDKEVRQKITSEIPPLCRIPSSVEPVNAAFLNALLRRVFLDMRTSTLFAAEVRRKIEKKFREINRPPFLGPIELKELDWGREPPQFEALKVHQPEKSYEVVLEADVKYEGGISATLSTTVYINFPRPMSAVIPIKAFLTISSLRGKLHMMLPNEANARFELCLVESPTVDMNVHVDFGKGHRISSLPKLKKFLFSAARKAIDQFIVYPSKITFYFPLPGRKPDPEVVTPKDNASTRNPSQGTTNSKGSALGSNPDNDDANACRFIALEFIDNVLNHGRMEYIERLTAEDIILHGAQVIDVPWQGRDAVVTWVKLFRFAFPDLFFYVEDCVMNGPTVTVRWTARGTFRAPLWDYPPTGDEHLLRGCFMFKVKDGNQYIAELYSFWSLGTVYGLV